MPRSSSKASRGGRSESVRPEAKSGDPGLPALLLKPSGIGLPDDALYPFPSPKTRARARVLVPYIETLMSDDEAWHGLFEDDVRLHAYQSVYGKKGKR